MRYPISFFIILSALSCSKYEGKEDDLNDKKCPSSDLVEADLSGRDLSGCDFSGRNLTKVNFTNADLTNTKFVRSTLRSAIFLNTKVIDTSFVDANLQGAQLEGGVWTRANLERTFLDESVWTNLALEGANFQKAAGATIKFNNVNVYRSFFGDATFNYSEFRGGIIQESLFSHTKDLTGMSNLTFDGVAINRNSFQNTTLANARFTNLTNFDGNDFTSANLSGLTFQKVSGAAANFDKATIKNAQFVETSLLEVPAPAPYASQNPPDSLPYASPAPVEQKTSFRQTNFENVSFESSKLDGSRFFKTDGSVSFLGSSLTGISFEEVNLKNSYFGPKTDLRSSTFQSGDLTGSRFDNARLDGVRFSKMILSSVRFNEVTGQDGNARDVVISDSQLLGFEINKAKFANLRFERITNFEGQIYASDMKGTSFVDIGSVAVNIFSSDLSAGSFLRSNLGFHVINNSKFDAINSEGFGFFSIKPWESNPFETLVRGASFAQATLKGEVANYFYEWLARQPNSSGTNCLSLGAVQIVSGQLLNFVGNSPFNFREVIMTNEMLKNLDQVTIVPTYCGGSSISCQYSANSLICRKN